MKGIIAMSNLRNSACESESKDRIWYCWENFFPTIWIGMIALSMLITTAGAVTVELTLEEYLKQVRANNPKIKIEELKPAISGTILEEETITKGFGGNLAANYSQNHSDSILSPENKILNYGWSYKLFPTGTQFGINFNNTQAPVNGEDQWKTTAGFTITQPLLFGGLLFDNQNTIDIKRYDYEISKVTFDSAVENIISQSLNLYWQYILTQEINDLSKELLKNSEDLLIFNQQRVSIGTVSESDILNSKSQIIKNKIDVQNSDNSLKQLKESILYNIGYINPLNTEVELKINDTHDVVANEVTYANAYATAQKERNEFELYSLQIAAAENALDLGWKNLFPQLNAFITYSFLGRDTSLGGSFGKAFDGLSLNNTDIKWGFTFNINTEINKYQIAQQRPRQIKSQVRRSLIDFQYTLRNDLRVKIRSLNNAYDVVLKNQEIVILTRNRYNIARKEYEIGKLDFTRLVNIEQELKQATISYLNSKLSYFNAKLALDLAQGTIQKEYGLE